MAMLKKNKKNKVLTLTFWNVDSEFKEKEKKGKLNKIVIQKTLKT